MNRSEFVQALGECVQQQHHLPVFKLSMLMDSGPRLRAGKNEQHCPITFLYDQRREKEDATCEVHQYQSAAAVLGLSANDADIIVSAADNMYMIGEDDNDAARKLRPALIEACGLKQDAAGGEG